MKFRLEFANRSAKAESELLFADSGINLISESPIREFRAFIEKYIAYYNSIGFITIEFDTENQTATVIPVK